MRSRPFRSALLGAAALGAISLAGTGVALAGPYISNFNITVWQGTNPNPGNQTDPSQIANTSNTIYNGTIGSQLASFQYTGAINFYEGGNTSQTGNISTFINSAGGTTAPSALNVPISSSPFTLTTFIEITGHTNHALGGSITSDDGSALYQGLNSGPVAGLPQVHSAASYTFNNLTGDFQILYVEANGLPAELKFDVTSVPEPGSLALLGTGLLGLGLVARRRRGRKV